MVKRIEELAEEQIGIYDSMLRSASAACAAATTCRPA